jgi:hypothetical protein
MAITPSPAHTPWCRDLHAAIGARVVARVIQVVPRGIRVVARGVRVVARGVRVVAQLTRLVPQHSNVLANFLAVSCVNSMCSRCGLVCSRSVWRGRDRLRMLQRWHRDSLQSPPDCHDGAPGCSVWLSGGRVWRSWGPVWLSWGRVGLSWGRVCLQ